MFCRVSVVVNRGVYQVLAPSCIRNVDVVRACYAIALQGPVLTLIEVVVVLGVDRQTPFGTQQFVPDPIDVSGVLQLILAGDGRVVLEADGQFVGRTAPPTVAEDGDVVDVGFDTALTTSS